MKTRLIIAVTFTLAIAAQLAFADAPLKQKLGLDMQQAKVVSMIQKDYRAQKRSVRQVLNKESRKLRRAKSANDGVLVAQLEPVVMQLQDEMRVLLLSEDEEIRQQLNAEQIDKFDQYIEVRNKMAGSSRDAMVLN